MTKFSDAVQAIWQNSGMPAPQFRSLEKRVTKLVERLIDEDECDKVFKGKWYGVVLERDLRDKYQTRGFNAQGVGQRANSSLAAVVDFSQPWVNEFLTPIRNLINQLSVQASRPASQQ